MKRISQQRESFKQGNFTPTQRVNYLKALKAQLKLHEKEMLAALQTDLGRSSGESFLVELAMVYAEIKLMVKQCNNWSRPKSVKASPALFGSQCTITPQPYGQVLIISPWNYPLQLAFMPLIGAIAAGNYVVLKLSESAIATNAVIQKIIESLPYSNEVIVYDGGKEVNQEILSHRFDYIFFTGSTQFGKEIMRIAAQHLTPVTLELGGKSPVLVTAHCNLEVAAKRIAWGKSLNAGQTCVAPDYLLVEKSIEEKLVERIIHYWHIFYGAEASKSPVYGRMITPQATARIQQLIAGEKILYGGKIDVESRYVAPTLVKVENPLSPLMQEEIFGPILPIITIDTLQEGVEFINQREKPLALYIFASTSEAATILSTTSSGSVAINDTIVQITNHRQPFGGVGASGMGAYHGHYSFTTFSHYRSVLHSSTRFDFSIKYPPYAISNLFKWLMEHLG
ncbi:MAG: aldehyde dehydrogenase family protein [Phocaeicola sp.]